MPLEFDLIDAAAIRNAGTLTAATTIGVTVDSSDSSAGAFENLGELDGGLSIFVGFDNSGSVTLENDVFTAFAGSTSSRVVRNCCGNDP